MMLNPVFFPLPNGSRFGNPWLKERKPLKEAPAFARSDMVVAMEEERDAAMKLKEEKSKKC
jgi:hypothetical protein